MLRRAPPLPRPRSEFDRGPVQGVGRHLRRRRLPGVPGALPSGCGGGAQEGAGGEPRRLGELPDPRAFVVGEGAFVVLAGLTVDRLTREEHRLLHAALEGVAGACHVPSQPRLDGLGEHLRDVGNSVVVALRGQLRRQVLGLEADRRALAEGVGVDVRGLLRDTTLGFGVGLLHEGLGSLLAAGQALLDEAGLLGLEHLGVVPPRSRRREPLPHAGRDAVLRGDLGLGGRVSSLGGGPGPQGVEHPAATRCRAYPLADRGRGGGHRGRGGGWRRSGVGLRA